MQADISVWRSDVLSLLESGFRSQPHPRLWQTGSPFERRLVARKNGGASVEKKTWETRNLTLNQPDSPVPLKTRVEAKFYSRRYLSTAFDAIHTCIIDVYIDAFEGGFLSALATRDHYSIAVGCLWGCSRAENRDETRRGEAVAIDLPEGSIVDRKSRQFKRTPGASFSTRHAKEQERQGGCGREEIGARLTSNKQLCCYENVYNEIIVSGILRPGCLGGSFLYYQFYSTKGPAQTAGGMSFVDGNNVTRVRHHVACASLY